MIYVISYYVIGVIVSLYFIHYYRLSNKTKGTPNELDGLGGLIGAWIWPLQIIKHIKEKK